MNGMVLEAFTQSLQTIRPNELVRKNVCLTDDVLKIRHCNSEVEESIQCGPETKITVVAFGKAAVPMMEGMESALGQRFHKGIVLAPEGEHNSVLLKSTILTGGRNNLPDKNSISSTIKLLEFIKNEDSEDNLFLFLISGGGSALLCLPVPGINLMEKLQTIKGLVSHGATISELNAVRQKLSDVKGGKLLEHINKSRVYSLIISDVIGDPLQFIASGPTVIPEHPIDCYELINRLGVRDLPANILELLQRNETPTSMISPTNLIIANNTLPLKFLKSYFDIRGFSTILATISLNGDATVIGRDIAHLIQAEKEFLLEKTSKLAGKSIVDLPVSGKVAIIFGGETTVDMKSSAGILGDGGRNQHLVLSAYNELHRNRNHLKHRFALLSAGTDGIDGPTNSAGAHISDENIKSSSDELFDRSALALRNFDSHGFWSKELPTAHIIIGPTGTNVMDIIIILLDYSE